MSIHFEIYPVGCIRKTDQKVGLKIDAAYRDALLGLEEFSHIYVFYWFHENDTAQNRSVLRVHPRGDKNNPLTGVFATHSPLRPNLVASSLCKIESISGNTIYIDEIDALDGSPVIDIKCYIPSEREFSDLRLPDWV